MIAKDFVSISGLPIKDNQGCRILAVYRETYIADDLDIPDYVNMLYG